MEPNQPPSDYDAFYFSHCFIAGQPYARSEHWLNFFDNIAEHIANEIRPATVLDAGCAMGFLVESLRKRGITAFGVDISEYAIRNVHPDIQPYCWIGSVSEPFPQQTPSGKYDLIISIEVVEHLDHAEAEKAIANFCQHSDQVLFSSTPRDYREATHINVQPVEHWAKLFARHGFFHDLDYDASYITHWAMLFRRAQQAQERLVQGYERKLYDLWIENRELRAEVLEMRRKLASNQQAIDNLKTQLAESEI